MEVPLEDPLREGAASLGVSSLVEVEIHSTPKAGSERAREVVLLELVQSRLNELTLVRSTFTWVCGFVTFLD